MEEIASRINFNSIKVRLKLNMEKIRNVHIINFNSIKVRLKPMRVAQVQR